MTCATSTLAGARVCVAAAQGELRAVELAGPVEVVERVGRDLERMRGPKKEVLHPAGN